MQYNDLNVARREGGGSRLCGASSLQLAVHGLSTAADRAATEHKTDLPGILGKFARQFVRPQAFFNAADSGAGSHCTSHVDTH
jgi:hypothetical protein